ncbi:hypothetical protein SS1G_04939 [Sclerotinia sclerotiorum 1980 UF-70]|uniref:Reverse transcriptase domain-containing protein n=1 Tax=Sclerotinia sclerotiorum (strain ATCC 18683 / 1980 / Ss-1) TaxID=665079 RepID=A7EHZ7_SCLS1|nr:hypothetical protein SS1G_04939 [Sclerotinia sclerotiorum 1980 UF-70]EDO02463.1 hypothetical protein SS1G_04939 [Sclerotinia sclerotiorum 1980 UF-70]
MRAKADNSPRNRNRNQESREPRNNPRSSPTRPQATIQAIQDIPDRLFEGNVFIGGDFNLLHHNWQPTYEGNHYPGAAPFVRWLDRLQLIYTSEIDKPTHRAGNVLDLAFCSTNLFQQGLNTRIADHLDSTSDHFPLLTNIPWSTKITHTHKKLRIRSLEPDLFKELLNINLTKVNTTPQNEEELDRHTEDLVSAILNSYNGAAKRALGQNTDQPWWNNDCSDARSRYRHQQIDKKTFRRVIRRAQKTFYQEKLDQAQQAKDVFAMTKWHRSSGSFHSPPMKDPMEPDATPATGTLDKQRILINNLLRRTTEVGDIPTDCPTVPSIALPSPVINELSIREAVLGAGNTAPGADELPTSILKIAWPLIESFVTQLYHSCIRIGHHPKPFRSAILTIIPKPNKADLSSLRSYRPIALLSVLGKGLERLIARQMSWTSVTHLVLASQQFGALPLRSAVDLTTCLTHDVEQALNSRESASLLTLDIKGAFDAVLPGRLIRRLREQGWPHNLIKWIISFSTGRMGQDTVKFGYADDVAILAASKSLADNAERITSTVDEIVNWGTSEGITFDPGKSELIHFSKHKSDKDPNSTPTVTIEDCVIKELNNGKPYLRWLGILFDKKLSFKWHVRELTAKALIMAKALKSLGNTTRGVPANLLRQAAEACVLKKAYYGAETWWPGRSRPGNDHSTNNGVDNHINFLNRLTLECARAILPVWSTTNTATLYQETGLRPPEIELDNMARTAAVRTRRLDPYHPLTWRAEWIQESPNRFKTRYARRILSLPPSERINPLAAPKWLDPETREEILQRIHGPIGRSKDEAATDFNEFYNLLPCKDIVIFSDGSKHANGSTGSGFVGYQNNRKICEGSSALGKNKEVYDTEAVAAFEGLRAATTSLEAGTAADI